MRNLLILFLLIPVFSCFQMKDNRFTDEKAPAKFKSFKEVPGVTEAEINAIEMLQKEYDHFIYAMPLSIEAFENIEGNISGFSSLYCEWLTQLFGIQFHPKIIDWLDILSGLETKEISFTGELTANPERQKIYHMTTGITSRPLKYFRIAGSRPLDDIMKERKIRCGFIEGTATRGTVIAELVPDTYEVIELSDVSFVYDALKSGQIDAFYYSNTIEVNFIENHDVISYDFFPLIYRPVSLTTQNESLRPIITVMEKILENGGLRYLTELYNAGEREYLKYKLYMQLTPEERKYINDSSVIPIAIDPGNYPDSFYDKREYEWRGIYLDILKEVTNLTGLEFKRKNDENASWTQVYQMLKDGEVAMVPELIHTKEREGLFIWPDIGQASDYYSLISHSNFPDKKVNEILYVKVGLSKNTAYTQIFKKWFPNHMNTVEYDSMNDAFDALQRGSVDMVMATQKRLLYLTHYLEQPYYKNNIVFDYAVDSKFGFNKDQEILCSIFNKTLGLINIKNISDKWLRQTYDYQLKLAHAQRPLFIGLSILLLCVLALVVILFTRSRMIGKKLELLVQRRTLDLQMQTTTLNVLFDTIPDLVFTLDTNLRFTQCNKKFLDHFGLTKEEVIGKTEACLEIPLDIEEEHDKWNHKVIDESDVFVFEERIPANDGTNPFFETVKAPLLLEGNKVGVLGIARNITVRKEMEEKALSASHTKSAFLANMSHEIRTPMNSIMGFSELAMDCVDISKIKDYLGKIRVNSEWLLQIINNILDISKIESGKMELEKIPFEMHDLFASCRTLVLPKAVEKGITLHFYAEPSLGKIPLGDPTRLRQVLVNFLSNSVKFTNSGIVKLFSKITSSTDNTITMHFEIKDSGIGMTPEQMDRIFDPFVQAESGTTRMYGGTGLGLSITKNIIEMMGGKIDIESAPGVGTKFCFDLVFDTIDDVENNTQKKIMGRVEIEKPTFDGEILLCEDNAMNQEVISEHLARVGLKTIVAENGRAGIEMVQNRIDNGEKQFDLIFMDIHMPVMDGLEASARLLAMKTGIPIIAMTANIMSTDIDIYLKSGMQDCIGKPFTSQELWHLLLKYFTPVNMENAQISAQVEQFKEFNKRVQLLFVKDNKKKFEEITDALAADDIKEAHRLAHTLKSNAGQIGKTILQQSAANIEFRLKDGINNVSDEMLRMLEAELSAVLNELQPLLEEHEAQESTAKAEASPLNLNETQKLFDELEPLLRNGNSECLNYMDILNSVPGSEKLRNYIDEYEFQEALAELNKLKKE